MFRNLLIGVACAALAAQQPPEQVFRATVNVVVAPTTVTDSEGRYVNGLEPRDFRLFDNDKPQDIKVDVTFVPISLVLAVQADAAVEAVLPKVKRIAPVLEGLVYGEQGEAAVVAFDSRIRVMQDFTSDSKRVAEALDKIQPGSMTSAMVDAVTESVRMLRRRPNNRRRILLLISETRDKGSEGKLRDALTDAQLNNVLIYTVNINRLVTTLTAKPLPPRPDHLPPAARPLPAGVPATPTTVAQATGNQGGTAEFIPLFVEIFRQAKAIFISNPAEVLTRYTGGREFSFTTQKGLEEALARVGDELHSQYIISYNPNNKMEAGFHEIKVQVARRPDVKIRTRPGYWLAAVPE